MLLCLTVCLIKTGVLTDSKVSLNVLSLNQNTGAPLRGGKRAQFNMFLRPIDHITITAGLTNTLFPVIWIDEVCIIS
jgi:CD36 family